jgi:hypothetical protein
VRFIREWGYSVKVGEEEAHQKWWQDNGDAFKRACPKGLTYIGTYGVVLGTEKQAGGYRMVFSHENYAVMDRMAEAMTDPKGAFGKLMRDSSRFVDFDLAAPWSDTLLKLTVDSAVFDPKK